jgi:hypothetical protein
MSVRLDGPFHLFAKDEEEAAKIESLLADDSCIVFSIGGSEMKVVAITEPETPDGLGQVNYVHHRTPFDRKA